MFSINKIFANFWEISYIISIVTFIDICLLINFETFLRAFLKSGTFIRITFKNRQSCYMFLSNVGGRHNNSVTHREVLCPSVFAKKTWDIFNSMRDIYFIFLSLIESKAVRKMKLIINIYVSTCVSHNVNLESHLFFSLNVNNIILFELSCWATLQTS